MIVARVPATSANMGPGFDCLGMAIELYNDVTLVPGGPFRVEIAGEGAETLPRDRSNLVARTVIRFFESIGRPTPSFALRLTNRIPMTGGLGSSSTALVGGLLAANRLAGDILSRLEVLRLAYELEGHPDNVAPAMLGGIVVSVVDEGRLVTLPLSVPAGLRAVLFLPRFSTSTREARRLLPTRVSLGDAVFNLSRSSLLVGALATGHLDLLRVATRDRLHQPHRQVLFPSMNRLFDAALEAGALAVWLSGSGSALLALTNGKEAEVAAAFECAAVAHGVAGRSRVVDLAAMGATVETDEAPGAGAS
jgi:homoserine kinase